MAPELHSEPCALSALGMVSALGSTLDETWRRLIAGDQSGFRERGNLVGGGVHLLGEAPETLPDLPASLSRFDCRNNRLALVAFEGIRPAVERAIAHFGPARVAIVAGSSTAGVEAAEQAFEQRRRTGALSPSFDLVQLEFGGMPEFLGRISGAQGPCYALSTACSTGAKALISARGLLELGVCDAVIAGAVDSRCRLTANGFAALQAVSAVITNPMSRNRDGLTLGEGGALFLLTRDPEGIQLLGAGESSDAHHMSAPEPNGRGAEACMRAALQDASIRPDEIAYLNLHGTGTPHNDAMESAAVERVFNGSNVCCSSTKPLVGHTLGASGALEAGFCWLMLDRQQGGRLRVPPHRFDGQLDGELPQLRLAGDETWVDVGAEPMLMSNSFGFGGSNSALVLGRRSG
ncbi:MAG: beta-ketoacyl-ACP synthase [bacterium]|nr:beta-ketoacyl-ACP synthase [bacterium]